MGKPDFVNLANCTEEARQSALDSDLGPSDPEDYNLLRGRLHICKEKLPPLYREVVFDPYVKTLDQLGPNGFTGVLLRDPEKSQEAGLMLDIAQSILQNGEGYQDRATDGFQEVVSDLYDGFLSAEDRKGVKPPDLGVVPPLVKWGRPDYGPYTWPVDGTLDVFGVGAAVVNLPPANARKGLLAWAALAHETSGHDILAADEGLRSELVKTVYTALDQAKLSSLAEYWSARIDETASDVLGILNMGPAAGIALIGYFRALNAAYAGVGKLRSEGPASDPHPADILRGYLAAASVRLLRFAEANAWGDAIEAEADKDLEKIKLEEEEVSPEDAKKSAKIVAECLVRTPLASLENHALGFIQNWWNRDEQIVKNLRTILNVNVPLAGNLASGTYAAHAVAAAVTAALAKDANIPLIFDRMLTVLKRMHDSNPSWGPLYVAFPGTLNMLRTYTRALD